MGDMRTQLRVDPEHPPAPAKEVHFADPKGQRSQHRPSKKWSADHGLHKSHQSPSPQRRRTSSAARHLSPTQVRSRKTSISKERRKMSPPSSLPPALALAKSLGKLEAAAEKRQAMAVPSKPTRAPPTTPVPPKKPPLSDNKRDARAFLVSLMSGIYTIVIFLIALSIEVSTLFATHDEKRSIRLFRESFYCYLFGVSLFFLIFFLLLRSSNRIVVFTYRVLQKDLPADGGSFGASNTAQVSAGSLYLRMGCIIFGIIGVLYYGIDIYAVIREDDEHQVFMIIGSTLGGIFMFVQMAFIFQNSKMVIHRFKHIGRVSTMHLVATNLCMMIRFLVAEEFHLLEEIRHHGDSHINPVRMAVSSFIPIMFTCQVEYSLICAAVMYLLWRNIGAVWWLRGSLRIDCTSSYKGLLAGLIVLVFTFVVLIINLISHKEPHSLSLTVARSSHYYYCFLYSFMIFLISVGFYQMRSFLFMKQDAEQGAMMLDDLLLFVGMVGEIMLTVLFTGYIIMEETHFQVLRIYYCFSRCVEVLIQTAFILMTQRLVAHTKKLQESKPGRNVISFLILANISLFFTKMLFVERTGVNTANSDENDEVWMVMISTTIPLCVFYRFHSSVCLAEIWKHSYTYKSPWAKVKTLLLKTMMMQRFQ